MNLLDVAQYCQQELGNRAYRYLKERGVTEVSAEEFGLGYCPFEFEGLLTCTDQEELREHKLIIQKDDGQVICPVRDTLAFPFVNQYGKTVSISFRPLKSSDFIKSKGLRKYWHVSFEKSTFLYGLIRAIPHIRKEKKVIVGEGQFDVIMAHQNGIKNTVGVCGTALSIKQKSILARYASEIIVVFDGDDAGQNAIEKVKDKVPPNVTIKVVILPLKEDIDSFLRKFGRDAFIELLATAQ
jgi:DNA primase